MSDLQELNGLQPPVIAWLRRIGISTRVELAAVGPVQAYIELRRRGFGADPALVFTLQAALMGLPVGRLPAPMRRRLEAELAERQSELPENARPEPGYLIVDGHLDLAYNALKFDRDPLRPVAATRQQEAETPSPNGVATVAVPDLLAGGVAVAIASVFVMPASSPFPFVYHEPTTYEHPADAHAKGMAQLDYYHALADRDERIRLVLDRRTLAEVITSHEPGREPLLGLVPSIEGAGPVRSPAELEAWAERGVRAIGPAWDDTQYAAGAWRDQGGLSSEGRELLEIMAGRGLILDLTHLSELASLEALERYEGPVVASHSNARALVPTPRQLSDTQIRLIAERDGLVGAVLFNAFLRKGYAKGDAKGSVTLHHVVAHIDHICQLLGDADHIGIGSDLDGGFGAADIPAELDTVADLPLLAVALRDKGYDEGAIRNILGGNWLRLLGSALPV
jgi:membrane dipeptidase